MTIVTLAAISSPTGNGLVSLRASLSPRPAHSQSTRRSHSTGRPHTSARPHTLGRPHTIGVSRYTGPSYTPGPLHYSGPFNYGIDFSAPAPNPGGGGNASADMSARQVLSSLPGMLEDTTIMDWGLPDPEPSPGKFDFSAIRSRIGLITSTGGVPVITLCQAPEWMTGSNSPVSAPTPAHYQDFATLAAKVAQSFPQVKYFVVWSEFKGFFNNAANSWNARGYTQMYNDVYTAIKRVRPDALIGGPYAPLPPFPTPQSGSTASTPHGPWGYLDARTLDAISYWLAHKAGADFVAVDGRDLPKTGAITDPLTATEKFAAADGWLRQRTSLPIWWIESRVEPGSSGWTEAQATAIRVATLIRMASSGATAGMQWLGDSLSDEGLWTAITSPLGGQPTPLARTLPSVLQVLRYPVSVVTSPHAGVLIAAGRGGTIAVNTISVPVATVINGVHVMLPPGQVRVTN